MAVGIRVVTPEGVRPAALEVRDGVIVAVHAHDTRPAAGAVRDAGDAVILPGLVDSHVHVNEPGRTEWEGFATATRAAAAGGVTTLTDMPLNSIPATVDVPALEAKRAAARGACAVDVGFLGGAIPGNAARLRALLEAGVLGFKCFLVPSGVDEFPACDAADLEMALATLAPLGAVLMAHCESPAILARVRAPAHTRSYAEYARSRPGTAETEAVTLLVSLAEQLGARVHVVHVSSGATLPLLAAARARGVAVTAEERIEVAEEQRRAHGRDQLALRACQRARRRGSSQQHLGELPHGRCRLGTECETAGDAGKAFGKRDVSHGRTAVYRTPTCASQ